MQSRSRRQILGGQDERRKSHIDGVCRLNVLRVVFGSGQRRADEQTQRNRGYQHQANVPTRFHLHGPNLYPGVLFVYFMFLGNMGEMKN